MRLFGILATALALTACGAMTHESSKSNKPSEESAKATGASLPAVTLIRVPVGADGKEMNDKAEMRLTNEQSIASESVESTFTAAKAPDKVVKVDELDKSSSTESFCGYGWGGFGGYYGYNWGFYRPMYYNYGYNYMWNYATVYPWGGYNYYRYNAGFGYGYSGYGW